MLRTKLELLRFERSCCSSPYEEKHQDIFHDSKKMLCDYKMDNINSVAVFLHIIERVHSGQVWEWAGQVIVSQIPTRE